MTEEITCEHRNKMTSAIRIRGRYRTYCTDCNSEILSSSLIAELFEEMEDYPY